MQRRKHHAESESHAEESPRLDLVTCSAPAGFGAAVDSGKRAEDDVHQ